jgi:hypothetical protein
MWSTPRKLTQDETDLVFEEFQEAFVPKHMHKEFLRLFGQPKAKFNNRFFTDEATYQNWNARLEQLGAGKEGKAEATVIYGSPERLEAHRFTGDLRRSLKDVIVDDWIPACAIVTSERAIFYIFVEPKMRGCVVRTVRNEQDDEEPIDENEIVEG